VKLFLILLSLTIGSAAIIKTIDTMSAATTVMESALGH
jgi:hypothetical protein